MTWRPVVAVVLVCAGTGLGVVSTLGLIVMRDWQDRLHYVGLCSFAVFLLGLAIVAAMAGASI